MNEYEIKRLKEAKRRRRFQRRVNMFSLQNHRTFWWAFLFVVWGILFPISYMSGCFSHLMR